MTLAAKQQEEFLMTGDVARILGISHTSVADLVRKGELSTVGKTPAGYRLYRRNEVERLAEARRKNPPKAGRPRKKAAKVTKKKTKKKGRAKTKA